MGTILAIDCGGSSCRGLLLDEAGLEAGHYTVLAHAQTAAANLYRSGPTAVIAAVLELHHHLGGEALAVAVAGARTSEDCRTLADTLESTLGVPTFVCADTRAALRAGSDTDTGIVVVAGTGSAAYGRDRSGREARAGGWGYRLGDEGSAYWLGVEALRAVIAETEGGPPTAMSTLICRQLMLDSLDDLRAVVYAEDSTALIAGLAPVVGEAARAGDTVATSLIARASEQLASLVTRVVAQLTLEPEFTVVLAGGLWRGIPELPLFLESALPLGASTRILEREPALGAARLARDKLSTRCQQRTSLPPSEWLAGEIDLHSLNTLDLLRKMNVADATVAPAVGTVLPVIAELVEAIWPRLECGGRLVYFGAGTSGRLAMLDAIECVPTFGTAPWQIQAHIAGGIEALIHPVEGAEDDADVGAREAAALNLGANDVVVGISASGGAAYVRGALEIARAAGSLTAALTCTPGSPLGRLAHYRIEVPTGGEIVAGSTRLKAGTATKLVLNMLSTVCMVRLGRVHRNLMSNLRPTSNKLRSRAIRIVSSLGHTDQATAQSLLEQSRWDVPTAIMAARVGSIERAQTLLAAHGGDLSRVLTAQPIPTKQIEPD
jgi:N-acetylmuramic acid 6-phosphate etherase